MTMPTTTAITMNVYDYVAANCSEIDAWNYSHWLSFELYAHAHAHRDASKFKCRQKDTCTHTMREKLNLNLKYAKWIETSSWKMSILQWQILLIVSEILQLLLFLWFGQNIAMLCFSLLSTTKDDEEEGKKKHLKYFDNNHRVLFLEEKKIKISSITTKFIQESQVEQHLQIGGITNRWTNWCCAMTHTHAHMLTKAHTHSRTRAHMKSQR